MNPFADAVQFELLRGAAMKGAQEFGRYEKNLDRKTAGSRMEIRIADRVMRMLLLAISSAPAVVLVGPPGTGKTELLIQVIENLNKESDRYGFSRNDMTAETVTPEEDWSFQDLVLGQSLKSGAITSVEGELLQAIRNDVWLLLDEMNRADMDRIFGGLLTWLSKKRVKVGTWNSAEDIPVYLDWSATDPYSKVTDSDGLKREYVAGTDWRLLGTYNAVDAQRVFRMGQALSRRFKHIPVAPASLDQFRIIIGGYVSEGNSSQLITERVSNLYASHLEVERAQLGPGLFVDIPRFLELGLEAYGDTLTPSDPVLLDELVAEAYFSSVGGMLARMETEVLADLSASLVSSGALSMDSWEWVAANIPTLQS